VTGSRAAEAARLESAESDLRETEAGLARLTRPARTSAMIEEALNGMRQDARWRSTKGCVAATVEASRGYCRRYFEVRETYHAALEHARFEKLRGELNAEVLRLKAAGAGRETDPQAGMLVRLTQGMLSLGQAQLWLNSWAALVVEMGAALIPAVALGHGFSGRRKARRAAATAGQVRELELCADGTWQVRE
jgi:hypothetical protein